MTRLHDSMSSNEMIDVLSENNYKVMHLFIVLQNYLGDTNELKDLMLTIDSSFFTSETILKLYEELSKSDFKVFIENVKRLKDPEEAKNLTRELQYNKYIQSQIEEKGD